MRKQLSIILLILLCASQSHAFGLWGSADLGLSNVASLSAAQKSANAYRDRVVADGGIVVDLASVTLAYKTLTPLGTIAAAYSSDWGVKKDSGTGAVSKLYSLAGAGSDLIQAAGANQPIWSANGQNGKPIITFNGTTHYMKTATFTLVYPTHIFSALNQISWTSGDFIWDGFALSTGRLFQRSTTPRIDSVGANTLGSFTTAATVGTWHEINTLLDGTSSQIWVDGAAGTNSGSPTGDPAGFTLGARSDGTTMGNFAIGEIIIFSVNTVPRTTAAAYMKAKWGTP